MDTNPAPFAFNGVHLEGFTDGLPSAKLAAAAALGALLLVNGGGMTALKIMSFTHVGIHDEMKISGVDIGVTQDFVFRQGRKGRHHTGFSGSTFTAYNHQFFH
jgi:hypothetical protein